MRCEELGCGWVGVFLHYMEFGGLFSNGKVHGWWVRVAISQQLLECQAIKWQKKCGADIVMHVGEEWVIIEEDERNLGLTYILKQYVCLLPSPKGCRRPPKCTEWGWKGWWKLWDSKEWLHRPFCRVFKYLPKSKERPWMFWLAGFGILARKVCTCSPPRAQILELFPAPREIAGAGACAQHKRWSSAWENHPPDPHRWARADNEEKSHPAHVHVWTSY